MLKKVFCLGSIVFLAFVLVACGDDEEEIANPTRGVWEDDTFTSEYLGLEFELPEYWVMLDDEEMEQFFGVVFDDAAPAMGIEISDDVLDALGDGQFHDMFAIHPFSGSNVQIIFERNPMAMLISEEDYIETMIEQLEEEGEVMGIEFRDFEVAPSTTTIGNYEWESISVVMEMGPGAEMNSHSFINIQGPNVRIIIITLGFGETLNDVLDAFN